MFNEFIPNKLEDYIIHKNIANKMLYKNINNLNNLLFYGISSTGKKHLIYSLINNVFKNDLKIQNCQTTVKINNNNITINYKKSLYHYEINLYEYGLYDKNIICSFIKEIISTKNVLNNNFKLFIINKLDECSQLSHLTLRRIIETYSENCRFIITANNLSKINDALRSRFELIRVPFPKDDDILNYLTIMNEKFNLNKNLKDLQLIIKTHNYNFNKINYNLFYSDNIKIDDNEIGKKFYDLMFNNEKIFMDELRKYIYKLHLLCYDFTSIFKYFFKYILDNNLYKNDITIIIKEISSLQYKAIMSNKIFFCLEKFFLFIRFIHLKYNKI